MMSNTLELTGNVAIYLNGEFSHASIDSLVITSCKLDYQRQVLSVAGHFFLIEESTDKETFVEFKMSNMIDNTIFIDELKVDDPNYFYTRELEAYLKNNTEMYFGFE